jgi:transcription elongation factor GreB
MSRAFVKEQEDTEPLRRPEPELPAGVPNRITPAGERRFREQLEAVRAARLAVPDDDARRRQLDEDAAWLQRRLATFVVTPAPEDLGRVAFGATVTIAREDGVERVLRVVGVDEVDVERGQVSFVSPVARALVGRSVGDEVAVVTPRGEERWEILEIRTDLEEG